MPFFTRRTTVTRDMVVSRWTRERGVGKFPSELVDEDGARSMREWINLLELRALTLDSRVCTMPQLRGNVAIPTLAFMLISLPLSGRLLTIACTAGRRSLLRSASSGSEGKSPHHFHFPIPERRRRDELLFVVRFRGCLSTVVLRGLSGYWEGTVCKKTLRGRRHCV